jgi:CHAT domain-containing protein
MRKAVTVLLLAVLPAAPVALGQPGPVPQDKIVASAAQQLLLEKAKQLDAEGLRSYHRGDWPKAVGQYQEALAVRRKAFPPESYPNGHPDLAPNLNKLCSLYLAVRDFARAESLVREALVMCRALYPRERFPNGHGDLAGAISNLGSLYDASGDYARAEPLLREALAMFRALYPKPGGHPHLAVSISNLGLLHLAVGEHARAEPLLREALAMYRALYPKERFPAGHRDVAASLNNLAGLHQAAGEYTRAEPLYREALAMRRALYPKEQFPKGHPALARSINNLGALYDHIGDYAQAQPLLREALAMDRALYPPERFPSGHPSLANSIDNVGAVYQAVGDYAQAEPLLREALAMRRALYPKERLPAGHPSLATSISRLGSLYRATGDHARAEPVLREALAMYSQLLRQYADLAAEAESRSFAGMQPLFRDGYLSNGRHLAGSATAYEALWDARAVLTRVEERRHRDLLASADRATAALADQLQRTRRSLASLLLSSGRDAAAHRQAVAQLTQAKEDLEKRLAARLQLAVPTPVAAVTTVQQLSDALPRRAVYVDLMRYVSIAYDSKLPGKKGQKRTASYVAFVVGKGRPVVRIELHEAAPIEAAWTAWHKALLAPDGDRETGRAAARALAVLVWEPIRAVLPADCQAVYLTPDGALAQVPWAALPLTPLPRGERGSGERESVLLDQHAVCLVPHGPWLLERLTVPASRRRQRPVDSLLAYGGIDYEGAPAVVAKSRGPRDLELVGAAALPVPAEKRLHWAALPGTAREQALIVALAKNALKDTPIIRSGLAASTEQLLEDLPKVRYAHLATHGFFADPRFRSYLQVDPNLYEQAGLGKRRSAGARSPLVLSGLVLAGANRRGEEAEPDRGIVTAEGLIGLRLDGLELAVLSACETGLGEVAGGEGVFGLQRAFHIAGAKNVVASLWKVDDEATAALMSLFYHHLWIEKKAPLDALRQAQLAIYRHPERIPMLARQRGPDFEKTARLPPASGAASARRAPARLWAGFVLSGAGR